MQGVSLGVASSCSGQFTVDKTLPDNSNRRIRVAILKIDRNWWRGDWKLLEEVSQEWSTSWLKNLDETILQMRHQPPDVLLINVQEPEARIIGYLRELKEIAPRLPIVVILKCKEPLQLLQVLTTGIRGCLVEPVTRTDLIQAISDASQGLVFLCRNAQTIILNCLNTAGTHLAPETLSLREQQIISLLFKKYSDKEIATVLEICPGTVHVHLANLYKRLEVHSRAELLTKFFAVRRA